MVGSVCLVVNSSFYCPGKECVFITVFAGVDDIEGLAIAKPNVAQNWLKKITDRPG